MVCSSNSPKLAKIKTVQRMAIDGHGVFTISKDFTLTRQREFRVLKILSRSGRRQIQHDFNSGLHENPAISGFGFPTKYCDAETLTAFMNSAE